jgi:hypothetical protein
MAMQLRRTCVVLLALFAGSTAGAAAQQAGLPYTLAEVIDYIEAGWPADRLLPTLTQRCLDFRVAQNEARLRRAGANAAMLTALRGVCYRGPVQSQQQPQQQGQLHIRGELPPGWSRVANQLPPNTNRTVTLTPGRPAVIVVSAPGWCPDRLELTMTANEERDWTPALRGRPWVGGCTEAR